MTPEETEIRRKLRDNFPHYASRCLNIRTKAGKVERLELNAAQLLIHERIEAQRAETGKVRAIILKGRQQGCSTYVEARYYWRVTHRSGVRAFILTHEAEATNNLFDMAVRYHENCPDPVRPSTGAANAKELIFDKLDSGYKVGTAGTKGVGRSSTIQYFHGSEVGFWPFAHEHAAGVMQAIPDAPDTEVILESTANGVGNFYHEQWTKAVAGESEFIAIFVPHRSGRGRGGTGRRLRAGSRPDRMAPEEGRGTRVGRTLPPRIPVLARRGIPDLDRTCGRAHRIGAVGHQPERRAGGLSACVGSGRCA